MIEEKSRSSKEGGGGKGNGSGGGELLNQYTLPFDAACKSRAVPLSRTRFPARQVIRRNVGKQEITLRHPSHPLPSIPGNQGQCHRVHNHQPTPLGLLLWVCSVGCTRVTPPPPCSRCTQRPRALARKCVARIRKAPPPPSNQQFFFYFPVICSNKHKHVGVGGGGVIFDKLQQQQQQQQKSVIVYNVQFLRTRRKSAAFVRRTNKSLGGRKRRGIGYCLSTKR